MVFNLAPQTDRTYYIEKGDHVMKVLYHDKPISGSPFRCQVFDSSKVIVRDLPSFANVGSPVEFDSWYHCFLSINNDDDDDDDDNNNCLLYTSPSPRDRTRSRMPSSA